MRYLITTFKDLSIPNGFTNNVMMDVDNILKYDKDANIVISCKKSGKTNSRISYITSSNNISLFFKTMLVISSIDILWINSYAIHYNALLAILARSKIIVYRAQDPVAYIHKIKNRNSKIKFILYIIAYLCERIVIKRSDYLLTVNSKIIKLLKYDEDRAFIIYNLAGMDKYYNATKYYKKEYLKLGYLGVVQRNIRGLEYQLALFNAYLKSSKEHLIIQFDLLANDSENELEYIRELIRELDLEKNVNIISAPVPDEKIREIINDIDIVILEPTNMHLPSKFFEYIYTGKIIMIHESAEAMKDILDSYGYYYLTLKFDLSYDLAKIKRFEEEYLRDDLCQYLADNSIKGREIVKRFEEEYLRDDLCQYLADNSIKGREIVKRFQEHNNNSYKKFFRELYD